MWIIVLHYSFFRFPFFLLFFQHEWKPGCHWRPKHQTDRAGNSCCSWWGWPLVKTPHQPCFQYFVLFRQVWPTKIHYFTSWFSKSVSLRPARPPIRPLKERVMTQMSQVTPLRSPQRKQKQLLQRKYMIALQMKHTPSSKMMMHSVYVATTVLSTSH